MKKIMIFLVGLLFIGSSYISMAQDRAISASQLPKIAQSFITTHFPNETIALSKIDKELLGTTYEVVLTNSIKIEFKKDGNWKEVDCKYKAVPIAIVPDQIANKAKELYADAIIVKIDRDRRDYEVKLNNGIELKFDLKFNLIDIDN